MRFRYYSLWLILLCFVVFILQMIPGFTERFLLDGRAFAEPWRFVTAIFLHGSFVHILYNMFALLLFGLILERLVGSNKFLIVFFGTGIIANLVSVNFYNSSLGASGAIFGVIGALIIVRPLLTVWAFGMPMPMFVAGLLWAGIDFLGVINPMDNTANIAHLSGIATGLIIGLFLRDWNSRRSENNRVIFDEGSVRRWEDDYLR